MGYPKIGISPGIGYYDPMYARGYPVHLYDSHTKAAAGPGGIPKQDIPVCMGYPYQYPCIGTSKLLYGISLLFNESTFH